jgi:acyl carrier protein
MSEFYEGLAEILEVEVDDINPEFELGENWDSLAIVSTIALLDDAYDVMVSPDLLSECKTVGAIEKLVAAEGGSDV